jgi:hypothetical protein
MPENKHHFHLLTEQRSSKPKKLKNSILNWYCAQSACYKLGYFQNAKHNYLLENFKYSKHDSLPAEKKLVGFTEPFFHFSVSLQITDGAQNMRMTDYYII